MPAHNPVVGFDLDMTLVDSAAGIAATMIAALGEHGAEITPAQIWPLIGIDLVETVATLAPQVDAAAVAARYRELYPSLGVQGLQLLPGAAESVEAVHARGGRVLVVSTKIERLVREVLDEVGLNAGPRAPDRVAGGLFGAGKGVLLRTLSADVYVGDHPGDVTAARVAGAVAVAVATGPHGGTELARCGADVVLDDLVAFPAWWDGFLAGRVAQNVPSAP